ncbi:unnamed protein product [Choristocarpus tenellus]
MRPKYFILGVLRNKCPTLMEAVRMSFLRSRDSDETQGLLGSERTTTCGSKHVSLRDYLCRLLVHRGKIFLVLLLVAGILMRRVASTLGGVGIITTTNMASKETQESASVSTLDDLSFRATNAYYKEALDKPGREYPWLAEKELVEPHRPTTLRVANPREGHLYVWDIRMVPWGEIGEVEVASGSRNTINTMGAAANKPSVTNIARSGSGVESMCHGNNMTLYGPEPQAIFNGVGTYSLSLREISSAGSITRTLSVQVVCRYVRRELRTLNLEDREEFLNTLKILYDTPLKEGKEKYGDAYLDFWSLYKIHFRGASDPSCDRLHDGLGFLVSHAMFTNLMEEAMQTVNPAVTMPYWDTTLDWTTLTADYNGDYKMLKEATGLWTPEWFGAANEEQDMVVTDGRWAYTSVPQLEDSSVSPTKGNVYGLMESPWNTNNVPFLSRSLGSLCGVNDEFYGWSTCKDHFDLLMNYSSLYAYTWNSMYDAHAKVHIWIGGTFKCTDTYDQLEYLVGEDLAKDLRGLSQYHRVYAWRTKIFKCHGSAELGIPQEDIMSGDNDDEVVCGCLDYDLSNMEDVLTLLSKFPFLEDMLSKQTLEVKFAVLRLLCTSVVNFGNQLTSSSPIDPTFWPIHPSMERLLMYKLLTGTMTDMTWPEQGSTYLDENGVEQEISIQLQKNECLGHGPLNKFPYGLITEQEGIPIRLTLSGIKKKFTLTNLEMLGAMDPRNPTLSYVYDNFDWLHCTRDGINFDDVWDSSKQPTNGGSPYNLFSNNRSTIYSLLSYFRELGKKYEM